MKNGLIAKAQSFAGKAHEGQNYDNLPYVHHCLDVAEIAKGYGFNDDIIVACLLHDTIEDTRVTYQDIKVEFGQKIAEIVYCVTDELGRNRKERKEKTLLKISKNQNAIIVKVCDRFANIYYSIKTKNKAKLKMYKSEHIYFCNKLVNIYNDENVNDFVRKLRDVNMDS